MKRPTFGLTLLLGALPVPAASTQPTAPVQSAQGVEWLATSHDFGAFKEDDGSVSTTFSFVNHGPEEVAIRAARASCGCTTPAYTKTPVAVGDTATVNVKFNPTGRPGRFSKSVTVDIAGGPRTRLVISGVVIGSSNTLRSRYPIEHGEMKLRTTQLPFGTVTKGKAKAAFLEVYNASAEPMTPCWSGLPPYIRIATSGSDTIPAGEQAVYALTLTPSQTELYGILTDSVFIAPSAGAEPLKIDLTAILEEDFSRLTPRQRADAPVVAVDPDRVNFGELKAADGPQTRTFTIHNRGKSDMYIRRLYTTDPGVTVSIDRTKIKKGKHATATVTVDPSLRPADILNARLQLIANDPETPISLVRVVGLLAR